MADVQRLCRQVSMDLAIPPELEVLRQQVRRIVEAEIMPLERDPSAYDAHENIALPVLDLLRQKVKSARLWAPQVPTEFGGLGLNVASMAVLYEEMGRSIFGPVAF